MQEEIKQYEKEVSSHFKGVLRSDFYIFVAHFLFQYNVEIKCLIEREPMGTAGPIGLAAEHLLTGNEHGFFFVLNSDIVCHYEF